MYILSWNPGEARLEASFGGALTRAEADVFVDELREMLLDLGTERFDLVMDYALTSRMDDGVMDRLFEARATGLFAGAQCVTFVTRSEDEVIDLMDNRLNEVLEGKERYVAFSLAA
jgi:hypothetical protein